MRSQPGFISSPERRIERPSKASSSSVHRPMQISASRAVRWRPVGGAGIDGIAAGGVVGVAHARAQNWK